MEWFYIGFMVIVLATLVSIAADICTINKKVGDIRFNTFNQLDNNIEILATYKRLKSLERDSESKDRENYLKGAEDMQKAVVNIIERGKILKDEGYVCEILNGYSADIILRSVDK